MRDRQEHPVDCPYCGESIDVLVDDSVPQQAYIEDCAVCCRPINFSVAVDFEGDIDIVVSSDNE